MLHFKVAFVRHIIAAQLSLECLQWYNISISLSVTTPDQAEFGALLYYMVKIRFTFKPFNRF